LEVDLVSESLHANLKSKAYKVIKGKIIRCEVSPGAPLSEKELMAEIGASRTPIREALNKLEEEQLVRIFPKRGIFVSEISAQDIVDIYSLRKLNEPYAAACAAESITETDLRRFRDYWAGQALPSEVTEHLEMDRAFHRAIAEATGNKYLIQLLSRLYDVASRIRYVSLGSGGGRLDQIRGEHGLIIDQLLRRNAMGAEQAMRKHLENAEQAALRLFPRSVALSKWTSPDFADP
jgi:GntR family transcriptional regulator, rspAB operon transcriptional repressor